ncbi:24-dehydrocholesterol reductase precursor [Colletotrichum sojae]|uniref:Delta(24)-sterol reductase n=1 Tax=Colletotrichum sojae TaxID=2175907 RepID=A0A8H6MKH3_9PEZI|nr:24-dehydrocholesterol reductase precursor [Colletotrichum sojae]
MEEEKTIKHKESVAVVAEKVKAFTEAGIKFRLYHGETNSTRPSKRKKNEILDISELNNIISIDVDRKIAIVEPNVSMDTLVKACVEHRLIPLIVPEFPGITVGGAFSGGAAESTSFKFGYFNNAIESVEFVLGDGSIIQASNIENADLYFGAAGTLGSLGVGTLFEVKLTTACDYVELRYVAINSMEDAVDKIKLYTDNTSFINFVEAIMFSPYSGALILGTLTDELNGHPVIRFSRAKDPWFYLHVHESVPHPRHTDCDTCLWGKPRCPFVKGEVVNMVPVVDYLFRYDRGAFWMAIYGQKSQHFHRFSRFISDRLVRTRQMYRTMHLSGRSQAFIIQDVALPDDHAAEFLNWANEKLHIYPIWLLPIKGATHAPFHAANRVPGHETLINIGLWGLKTAAWPRFEWPLGREAFARFVSDNRAIEHQVRAQHGLKWLYGVNYYSEEEFWGIYDKAEYDKLRDKYGAKRLPSVWDKINNENPKYEEKLPFWKAIYKSLRGHDYLLPK